MSGYKKCTTYGSLVSPDATRCRMCTEPGDSPGTFVEGGAPGASAVQLLVIVGLALGAFVALYLLLGAR